MNPTKVGADDYIMGTGAQADAVDGLPRVDVDGRPDLPAEPADLKALLPVVLEAIKTWNAPATQSPRVYNVAGTPSRLDWTPDGEPHLVALEPQHYLTLLAEAAYWTRPTRSKRASRGQAIPPKHVIDALRAQPATWWPALQRFVAAPFFRRTGELVTRPGYDRDSGYYYLPQADLVLPDVPARPSAAEIQEARRFLTTETLGDFCWRDSEADVANALAIMLTPFLRPLYQGHTPLAVISKPVARAGAGLLIDVLLFPVLGRMLPRTSLPSTAEELRKSLFAFARERDAAILFDNVDGPLDQSPLAAFLTSDRIRDRILGVSQSDTVDALPLIYATGNGVTVSSEMGPRVCLVELDPKMEHPGERTGFRHDPLRAWVQTERGRLLWACLTLIRATIAQDWPRPPARPVVEDLQEWVDRITSVLHVADVPGFLTNRSRLRGADPVGEGWRFLMRRVRDAFPGPTPDATRAFTAGQLWPLTGWRHEALEFVKEGEERRSPDDARANDVAVREGLRDDPELP